MSKSPTAPVKRRKRSTGWNDPRQIRARRIAFLWANIDVRGPDECWPWKRKLTSGGYGQLRWFTGTISAYRAAYEMTYGELPKDPGADRRLDLDHTCHDAKVCKLKTKCPHRACCNPAHLEVVTRRENLHRSMLFTNDRCRRGHLFTEENTYLVKATGQRQCRACIQYRRLKSLKGGANRDKAHCKRGHEFTPENTYYQRTGENSLSRECKACRVIRRAERTERIRALKRAA